MTDGDLRAPHVMLRVLGSFIKPDCTYCRAPCCQLAGPLSPEEVSRYETQVWHSPDGDRTILKRKEDGYCVYHVQGIGCSIYDKRPEVCNGYSCVGDAQMSDRLKYGKVVPVVLSDYSK